MNLVPSRFGLALLLAASAPPLASGASWVFTDRLITPRLSHTATLLPDGRVLVAGGRSNGPLAVAETYDPARGRWEPAPSMATPHEGHTATLLADGTVLVAGGNGNPVGCEIFDPRSGSWRTTGPLSQGRTKHTATLLRDGSVLVVGGLGGVTLSTPLASAERYVPASGTWSATGPTAAPHADHTANLLADGRVVVASGSTREIYNPSSGVWSGAAPFIETGGSPGDTISRRGHASTVLADGRVLTVGGALGGGAVASSNEIYDPALDERTRVADLEDLANLTATLLPNGRVLVAGGVNTNGSIGDPAGDPSGVSQTQVRVYDVGANTWTDVSPLGHQRTLHTATLLPNGRVLVVGGIDPRESTVGTRHMIPGDPVADVELLDPSGAGAVVPDDARPDPQLPPGAPATLLTDGRVLLASAGQIYDPATGLRAATGAPSTPHPSGSATLLVSGKVLLLGGGTAVAEVYDPVTGLWSPTGSLALGRSRHSATLLPDGRVLVVGGTDGLIATALAEVYNPTSGTWSATGSLATPRLDHTASLLPDGRVLVTGGISTFASAISGAQVFLGTAELFDPVTGAWTSTGALSFPRADHAATVLAGGRVLVVGGTNNSDTREGGLRSGEIYDPSIGTWTPTGTMSIPRVGLTSTLLLNGKVLIVGASSEDTGGGVPKTDPIEIFDPASGVFSREVLPPVPPSTFGVELSVCRRIAAALTVLPDGKVLVSGGDNIFPCLDQTYAPDSGTLARRPRLVATSGSLAFGVPFSITGNKFRGDSEAGSGATSSSAVNYPIVQVRSVENGLVTWIVPDARANLSDEPMTLQFSRLPATLNPGFQLVTAFVDGMPSLPASPAGSGVVGLSCSVAITTQPVNQTVALGGSATFGVAAQGARRYQWRKDGIAIPGATGPTYTTPPVAGADSGSQFTVVVTGACATATSQAATLIVADATAPTASVVSPNGGEYWLLSETGSPAHQQVVTWSMSDNVRVCLVEVSLLYSNDGGANYLPAPAGGGLPATHGSGGTCTFAQAVGTTSLTYTIPTTFPSGVSGSLYKVRVRVTDHVGLQANALSPNPFYIVRPNPDSVKTLILSNPARLQSRQGVTPTEASALAGKLQELAAHPRVLGLVVDLNGVTDITSLYAAWDADQGSADKANAVLFGCHAPLPAGCTAERSGIHDQIRTLLGIYSGVRYLILAGDDRIIPFARLQDRTSLFSESNYPAGGDLTPTGTTVGRALAANKYLSDDPLAVADAVRPDELTASLFLPDLAGGRLVETPGEMTTAIATFISQDGVLDLSALDPVTGHKVLVTGYDFLSDSAVKVRERWKAAFGAATPVGSPAPVDGSLVGGTWNLGSVAARVAALRTRLAGNGGGRYGLMSLAGHATHFEEGVPGTDPFDIQGLPARDLYGADACATPSLGAVDLAGGVVYAVGCHGGLAVAGSCATDANHSLDLPQTMLSRGVVSYVANTGYGWGLKFGVGYGERLVDLLTEEMTKGGTVVTGDAVRRTKLRYFLETPRYDSYDEKSLMQWTLYGLPMYAVKTGLASGSAFATSGPTKTRTLLDGAAPSLQDLPATDRVGKVTVARSIAARPLLALPSYLTQLNLSFDFTAPGVYTKRGASGDALPLSPGCTDPVGCYYTLNGLVERASGAGDLPIQPYFIYDSRLSGTSQHGVLWKGGTYDEEVGWKPVFGELQSNGGDGSNHGAAPRLITIRPTAPRVVPGTDPETCRPSDLELNSLVVGAGEAAKPQPTDAVYSLERRYRTIDLEALYFDNPATSAQNCDRQGPDLLAAPLSGSYHQVSGATVSWAVPATDASGVWRVLVVSNDNAVDGSGRGTWSPLDLVDDGTGTFRGSRLVASGSSRITYVIQAVDNRGNVTWLDYVTASLPSSGVALGVPLTVDATLAPTVTVSGFTPTFGVAGTSVVVSGTQFTGATSVTFGGKPAAVFAVDSATQITATVPATAVSGLVAVTTPLGTGTSASIFTMVAPPTVTSFTPVSGPVGTSVAITGTNFTQVTEVSFGGMPAATFTAGSPTQAAATVPPGASTGKIAVTTAFGRGLSADDFVVSTPLATRFHTIPPCRAVDTRTADAPALTANVSRTFAIGGRCGIPLSARAVSLNVTVTEPAAAGNLRLFAAGTATPAASALNYSAGQIRGNNAIIPLNAAGELAVLCSQASGTTQVIVDLNGYFE